MRRYVRRKWGQGRAAARPYCRGWFREEGHRVFALGSLPERPAGGRHQTDQSRVELLIAFTIGVASLYRLGKPGFWPTLLGATLALVVGVAFLRRPDLGAVGLTLLLGSALLVGGVTRIVGGIGEYHEDRGWIIAGGVISLLLGLLILFGWPGVDPVGAGHLPRHLPDRRGGHLHPARVLAPTGTPARHGLIRAPS